MWRSGASEAIGRFLPPSCKKLTASLSAQTVIKLPKKKYTPKQDVQLGKEAASEVRKQYPILEDQHIAKYLTQIGGRRSGSRGRDGARAVTRAAAAWNGERASKAQNSWLQLGQIAGAVVGGELGGYIAEGTQVGLGTLLLRYSRDYEKQADLLGSIMARAGYDPRALAHAPSRSASIRLNKTATWFQMALFWSTILSFPPSIVRK